jgi:hypothetical protein
MEVYMQIGVGGADPLVTTTNKTFQHTYKMFWYQKDISQWNIMCDSSWKYVSQDYSKIRVWAQVQDVIFNHQAFDAAAASVCPLPSVDPCVQKGYCCGPISGDIKVIRCVIQVASAALVPEAVVLLMCISEGLPPLSARPSLFSVVTHSALNTFFVLSLSFLLVVYPHAAPVLLRAVSRGIVRRVQGAYHCVLDGLRPGPQRAVQLLHLRLGAGLSRLPEPLRQIHDGHHRRRDGLHRPDALHLPCPLLALSGHPHEGGTEPPSTTAGGAAGSGAISLPHPTAGRSDARPTVPVPGSQQRGGSWSGHLQHGHVRRPLTYGGKQVSRGPDDLGRRLIAPALAAAGSKRTLSLVC